MKYFNLLSLIILTKAVVSQFAEDSDVIENIPNASWDSSSECGIYEQCESYKPKFRKEIMEEREEIVVGCVDEYDCRMDYETILPNFLTSKTAVPTNITDIVNLNTTISASTNNTSVTSTLQVSLPTNDEDTGNKNKTNSTALLNLTLSPTPTQPVSTVSTELQPSTIKCPYDRQRCNAPNKQMCVLNYIATCVGGHWKFNVCAAATVCHKEDDSHVFCDAPNDDPMPSCM